MSKVKVNSWEKNGCVQVLKEQYKEMLHFVVYDERIQECLNLVSERRHKKTQFQEDSSERLWLATVSLSSAKSCVIGYNAQYCKNA